MAFEATFFLVVLAIAFYTVVVFTATYCCLYALDNCTPKPEATAPARPKTNGPKNARNCDATIPSRPKQLPITTFDSHDRNDDDNKPSGPTAMADSCHKDEDDERIKIAAGFLAQYPGILTTTKALMAQGFTDDEANRTDLHTRVQRLRYDNIDRDPTRRQRCRNNTVHPKASPKHCSAVPHSNKAPIVTMADVHKYEDDERIKIAALFLRQYPGVLSLSKALEAQGFTKEEAQSQSVRRRVMALRDR